MYTGIVEETGKVVERSRVEGECRLRLAVETGDLAPDDSIGVSGVCLTATSVTADGFEAFLSAETVERTYLADLEPGDPVNVERPLPADGRFDGHVVRGTVDTTIEVRAVERSGDGREFTFELPPDYAPYVVPKGAVAIDGISLTVADVTDRGFAVAVIPRTYELTTLSGKRPGDPVHLEVDVLAKYVERQRTVSA